MEKARETFLTHEHMSTYTHEEKIYIANNKFALIKVVCTLCELPDPFKMRVIS